MKHKIIKNFLPEDTFKKIQTELTSSYFPWFFNNYIASTTLDDDFYFTHTFYNHREVNSSYYETIKPILNLLKPRALMRIKANLYYKTPTLKEHPEHMDYPFAHKGAIYYINDNDGYTVLKGKHKIKSEANSLLLFDPSEPHNSTSCTDAKARININFNYF